MILQTFRAGFQVLLDLYTMISKTGFLIMSGEVHTGNTRIVSLGPLMERVLVERKGIF